MSFKEILSIPIYRCTPEQHSLEIKQDKEKYLEWYKEHFDETIVKKESDRFDTDSASWKYNEIVGWLELHLQESKLIAKQWIVKEENSKVLKSKTFVYFGKAFESFFHGYTNDEEISKPILKRLKEWYEDNGVGKNCYMDLEGASFKIASIKWVEIMKANSR